MKKREMMFKEYEDTLNALEESIDFQLGLEKLFVTEALNRILAQDIIASFNNPEYETASMDGYAIRAEDQTLEQLSIADKLPAGSYKDNLITKGVCIKTFTGSLMSKGSDTLIPIENVTVDESRIKITAPVKKGFSVRPVGENYKKGEILIKKGTKLRYAEIGVLAELGLVQVSVFVRPRISILATGSEILDFGEERENISQIRSSNHVTIEAILKNGGAQTSRLEIVKDDKEKIEKSMLDALNSSDVLVTTGGVSVGDFDFVKDALGDIQPEFIISGALIKPGRHIKVARIGRKYIFSLPGFPYSSSVVTFLYILPFLRKISGRSFCTPSIKAFLQEDYQKRSRYREFIACSVGFEDGKVVASLGGKKVGSSAILNNMLDNAALLCVSKETKEIKKGALVDVLILDFDI